MEIIYFAQFDNPFSDSTEKHITNALEDLDHTVYQFKEKNFKHDKNRILERISDGADLFLFHKGGIRAGVPLEDFVDFLGYITCKKAYWFFDKISDGFSEKLPSGKLPREGFIDSISPYVDKGFITDGTFIRRRNYPNIELLRQGVAPAEGKAKKKDKYKADVAFIGAVYGKRKEFVEKLSKKYDFKVFNNAFGKDLKDLCKTVKIIVAPKFPSDNFYWSSRIYQTLGNGGFLIHPKLHGLKEEFEEGKHFVGYKGFNNLFEKIDYYLENEDERKKIQKAGKKHCLKNYTYKNRVKEMLDKLNG